MLLPWECELDEVRRGADRLFIQEEEVLDRTTQSAHEHAAQAA